GLMYGGGLDDNGATVQANEQVIARYRQLAETDPTTYMPALALALCEYSDLLGALGHAQDAVAPAEEAATILKRLVATEIEFLPNLASSLNNLSVRLRNVDRAEEALAAGQEAVIAAKRLATIDPDVFLPDLASALHNLSLHLGKLGWPQE